VSNTYTVQVPGIGNRTITSDGPLSPDDIDQYVQSVQQQQQQATAQNQAAQDAQNKSLGIGPGTPNFWKGPSYGASDQEAYDTMTQGGALPDPEQAAKADFMAKMQQAHSPLYRAGLSLGVGGNIIGGLAGAAAASVPRALSPVFPGIGGYDTPQGRGNLAKMGELGSYAIPGVNAAEGASQLGPMMAQTLQNGPVSTLASMYHSLAPWEGTSAADTTNRVMNLGMLLHGGYEGVKGIAGKISEGLDSSAAKTYMNSGAGGFNERGFISVPGADGLGEVGDNVRALRGLLRDNLTAARLDPNSLKDAFLGNLYHLESFSPDSMALARQVAGAPSIARTSYGMAKQLIDSIGGDGYFEKKFVPALTESNIASRKTRLAELGTEYGTMDPDTFAQHFAAGHIAPVLDAIEAPQDENAGSAENPYRSKVSTNVRSLIEGAPGAQELTNTLLSNVDGLQQSADALRAQTGDHDAATETARADLLQAQQAFNEAVAAHQKTIAAIIKSGANTRAKVADLADSQDSLRQLLASQAPAPDPNATGLFSSHKPVVDAADAHQRTIDTLNQALGSSTTTGLGPDLSADDVAKLTGNAKAIAQRYQLLGMDPDSPSLDPFDDSHSEETAAAIKQMFGTGPDDARPLSTILKEAQFKEQELELKGQRWQDNPDVRDSIAQMEQFLGRVQIDPNGGPAFGDQVPWRKSQDGRGFYPDRRQSQQLALSSFKDVPEYLQDRIRDFHDNYYNSPTEETYGVSDADNAPGTARIQGGKKISDYMNEGEQLPAPVAREYVKYLKGQGQYGGTGYSVADLDQNAASQLGMSPEDYAAAKGYGAGKPLPLPTDPAALRALVKEQAGDVATTAAAKQSAFEAKVNSTAAKNSLLSQIASADRLVQAAQRAAVRGAPADATQMLQIAQDMTMQAMHGAASVSNSVGADQLPEVLAHPELPSMLQAWDTAMGQHLQASHLSNEGVLTNAVGPMGRYIPLVRDPEVESLRQFASDAPSTYGERGNIANRFSTGAGQYTIDPEALMGRIGKMVRNNSTANLISEMQESGLLEPTEARLGAPGLTMRFGERDLPATVEQSYQPLKVMSDGKMVSLPRRDANGEVIPQNVLIPTAIREELNPILHFSNDQPNTLNRAAAWTAKPLNWAAVKGWTEPLAHARNLGSVATSQMPLAGTSLSNKLSALTAPTFGAGIANEARNIDFKDPQTAADLVEIAKLGSMPSRAAVGLNETAPIGPSKLKPKNLVFGPEGLDLRLRLVMYRRLMALDPNMPPAEVGRALDGFGTYTRGLSSQLERSLKDSGISPFATAAKTKKLAGLRASTFQTPAAGADIGQQRLIAGIRNYISPIAMWYLGNKIFGANHQFPGDDQDAKFMQTRLPGGAYFDWGGMSSADEMWKDLGLGGFHDALSAGATPGHAATYGLQDVVNRAAEPITGSPLVRFLSRLVLGAEPHASLMDQNGKPSVGLLPAIPNTGPELQDRLPMQVLTALLGTNSIAAKIGNHFGVEPEYQHNRDEDKSNWAKYLELAGQTLLPGTISEGASPADRSDQIDRQEQ